MPHAAVVVVVVVETNSISNLEVVKSFLSRCLEPHGVFSNDQVCVASPVSDASAAVHP